MSTTTKKTLFAALASVVALSLTACGSDAAEPSADRTAPNGEVFNDADVEFATAMIPHHAQALEMVDLTVGRDLSPEVSALAAQIQAAQAPEVEQMTDWLTASGDTCLLAAANPSVSGSSAITGQPATDQRKKR